MKTTALAALTALGLSAVAAQASIFTVDYEVPNNPFGSDNWYTPVTIDSEIYDGTFRAGQFSMSSDNLDHFFAFCVEITQGLRNGHEYEIAPALLSVEVQVNIDRLFSSAYNLVQDGLTAAGFQVALWEIVEDTSTGFDLSSGNFSAVDASSGAGVVGTAQGYLDGLATAPSGLFQIDFLTSATSQDLLTARPTPVPLPAGGMLLMSGLGGLVAFKRMKKRAA